MDHPDPFDRSDASIRPVRLLARRVVEQALLDALAGRQPVSVEGLRPWLEILDLPVGKLPEVLARARRVERGW